MSLKEERNRIRKKYFSTAGLIIINILGCIGIGLIFFSGIFDIKNLDIVYDYYVCGIMIILGLFFFGICLYFWILFFLNIIKNPKKEVLYLYKNERDQVYFIDNKGKKFGYDNCNKRENCYYYVLKTHNYIYSVLDEYNGPLNNWNTKEKKSYWLNMYSPVGNFEDIFLLPIVYMILLTGLLSAFMLKGHYKIYGLIFSIVPFYDMIYKVKLRNSNNQLIDETKFLKSYEIFKNIISIIIVSVFCIVFINIFYDSLDLKSKLIFIPFFGCVLCSIGLILAKFFNQCKLQSVFSKCCIIAFLICWFGFLVFWIVELIQQEEKYLGILFSIPFWIVGGFIIYRYFIKRK